MVSNRVALALAAYKHGSNFVFESQECVSCTIFDQCVFGASTAKTTLLVASADLAAALSPPSDKRFCTHPPGPYASVAGTPPTMGVYNTCALQAYRPELNAAMAAALQHLRAAHAGEGG
eukprot:6210223-Pleurochrysis_carterae.AAC.4